MENYWKVYPGGILRIFAAYLSKYIGAKISDRAASLFFGGEVFTSQRSRGDPRSICTRHSAVTIKGTMPPEKMRIVETI